MADQEETHVLKMPTEAEIRKMFALLGRDPEDYELARYLGKVKNRPDEFLLTTDDEMTPASEGVTGSD